MNSPQFSDTSADNEELFQDLLNRLRECHDSVMQGLQSKMNKLKRDRCLDAQKLEEFYNRNQRLCEQQKTLQESNRVLKDRLQLGPCGQCREREKWMKKTQAEFENQNNLSFLNELKAERDILKEENRKLSHELEQIRAHGLQQTSFSEPEEGMIPDSPLQPISFPVISKLKRKRDQSHIRYAEQPLSQPLTDVCKREPCMPSKTSGAAVLVPETCDLDVMYFTNTKINTRTVVTETCRLDFDAEQNPDNNIDSQTLLHTVPNQAEKQENSPSNRISRSEGGKQKHVSVSPPFDKEQDIQRNNDLPKYLQKQKPSKSKFWESVEAKPSLLPPCKCPLLSQNSSENEQSWSVDPGAALSQYGTDSPTHPEPRVQAETVDMDCTFVSHSLLVRSRKQTEADQTHSITGVGQKANDSLANIFDTTGYGEYESCPQDETSELEHDHIHENEEEEDEKGEETQEEEHDEEWMNERHIHRNSSRSTDKPTGNAAEKSFACVEVIRKKNERRKLQGHTCKECEIYYADLPEAERRKKLSCCSRHRFRYIPPSTPDNFWEVGFPSTQTCVERGYIKDDDQADPRLRRRRPYLATFSPKAKASQT